MPCTVVCACVLLYMDKNVDGDQGTFANHHHLGDLSLSLSLSLSLLQSRFSDLFRAWPLEGDIFEWHFTLRGPLDTPYARGLYHGRLQLPTDWPFKPPDLFFMTVCWHPPCSSNPPLCGPTSIPPQWRDKNKCAAAVLLCICIYVCVCEYSRVVASSWTRKSA